MNPKHPSLKRFREASLVKNSDALPDVALAAIASYKKQKEVGDFINYMLGALDRNSDWLNNVVGKQSHFRCALMTGSGPNRFQIQQIIYPSEGDNLKLEVELTDSEDHDKVALAALIKISNAEIDGLLKYIKTRMYDNPTLKDDLLKGKALGISFAVLRPISEKQYRVMDRLLIGNNLRTMEPVKKRRKEEKSMAETISKKTGRKV